jgi:hypothetical protein
VRGGFRQLHVVLVAGAGFHSQDGVLGWLLGVCNMMSFNEKIRRMFFLSNELCGLCGDDLSFLKDEETEDMIWGHADGLSARRLYALRDGRCSLQAMIDFDPEVAEALLDDQLARIKQIKEAL